MIFTIFICNSVSSLKLKTENMKWISRNRFHFYFQSIGQTDRRTIGSGFKSDVKKSLPEHYAWSTRGGSRISKPEGGGAQNKIHIVNMACWLKLKFINVMQSKFTKINPKLFSNRGARARCAGPGSAFVNTQFVSISKTIDHVDLKWLNSIEYAIRCIDNEIKFIKLHVNTPLFIKK